MINLGTNYALLRNSSLGNLPSSARPHAYLRSFPPAVWIDLLTAYHPKAINGSLIIHDWCIEHPGLFLAAIALSGVYVGYSVSSLKKGKFLEFVIFQEFVDGCARALLSIEDNDISAFIKQQVESVLRPALKLDIAKSIRTSIEQAFEIAVKFFEIKKFMAADNSVVIPKSVFFYYFNLIS
jgi:hypothetical protein